MQKWWLSCFISLTCAFFQYCTFFNVSLKYIIPCKGYLLLRRFGACYGVFNNLAICNSCCNIINHTWTSCVLYYGKKYKS